MASTNGFILGLIGGLLDFASASLLLVGQSGTGMMGGTPNSAYEWAGVLILLGAAVITTSVLSVGSIGIRLTRVFSLLMVAYGVIMLIIGGAMTTGFIMSAGVSSIYSYGMVIVGGAMVLNGILMTRGPMPI